MGKHYFRETTTEVKESQHYRLIYCVWCGLVAWNFSKTDDNNKYLQAQVGNQCKGNAPTENQKKDK